jgi:hypothetical protein
MRSGSCPESTRGRRKAAERAIALGDDDPFVYALALEMGRTHAEVLALPNDELIRWQAFFVWREAMRAHAADVAAARAART